MPLPSSNRTCGFPASGSPEEVALGMRRPPPRTVELVQQYQTERLEMLIPAHGLRRTVRPLTPPLQMPDQTAAHEPVNLPPGTTRISIAEVVRPSPQVPIQAV